MKPYRLSNPNLNFEWMDCFDPQTEELLLLKNELKIPKNWIENCLLPDHLPLLESGENFKYLVLRVFDENSNKEENSIQCLSRKVIFFITETKILTIHRADIPHIAECREEWGTKLNLLSHEVLLLDLISKCLDTYTKPLNEILENISKIEDKIFSQKSTKSISEKCFKLKKENAVLKRILRITHDVFIKGSENLGLSHSSEAFIKERTLSLFSSSDEIDESIDGLLNQLFMLDSQKTNDLMKILTLFSALFMPVNLITGIFGMNFESMPLIKQPYGFWLSIVTMNILFLVMLFFFLRKDRKNL